MTTGLITGPVYFLKKMITIRKASQTDLDAINEVIESAVMGWDLPERVKRLSLSSYRYNEIDYQYYTMFVAEQDNHIIGIAAVGDLDMNMLTDSEKECLLHGIYVIPEYQSKGIGKQLLNIVEAQAIQHNHAGLMVKAQKGADGFFENAGYSPVEVKNSQKDYANSYWKSLNA